MRLWKMLECWWYGHGPFMRELPAEYRARCLHCGRIVEAEW